MYRALVLCRSLAQAEECQRHIQSAKYADIQYIYPPTLTHKAMDYTDLYRDCKELITEDCVDLIVHFHPGLGLVQAALVNDFDELKGPSFESVFLCIHKIYNKRYVTEGFNCYFGEIIPEDVIQSEVASILEETGIPVWVSDNFRLDGAMKGKKARSVMGVLKDKEEFHKRLCETHDLLGNMLQDKIHSPRYEITSEKICLLEEYWDPGMDAISIHIVEGCVVENEFIPWTISDVLYWKDRPWCMKGILMPSHMIEATKFEIWATMREIVQRLMSSGFNDQFIHVVILLTCEGQIKILDMNTSVYVKSILLNKHVYQNGDPLRALCDIGLGREPSHPKQRPQRCGMMGCLTSAKPAIANELIQFKVARNHPDVHTVIDENASLETKGDKHVTLAHIYALEESEKDCESKIRSVMKSIVVKDADITCLWLK